MDEEILAVQRLYPQIYHACHARHPRSRARNGHRLSERDQSLLAHLSPSPDQTQSDLARHVGVGLPTLSAAVKRLEAQGYVARERASGDRRATLLRLTERGIEALRGTSVLDDARLGRALRCLSATDRRAAVRGLELLAEGCRTMQQKGRRA